MRATPVQYLFGMPKAVFARKATGYAGEFDHIVCQYIYDEPIAVTAEGGWVCSNSFGFQMSFDLVMEKATVNFDITRDKAYRVCPADGDAFAAIWARQTELMEKYDEIEEQNGFPVAPFTTLHDPHVQHRIRLGRKVPIDLALRYFGAPLQIYLAESACSLEQLADNVNDQLRQCGRCVVVISEGFDVGSLGEVKDSFGHTSFGSSQITVGQTVVNQIHWTLIGHIQHILRNVSVRVENKMFVNTCYGFHMA